MSDKNNKKTNGTFMLLSVFGILFVVLGHCKRVNVFFSNIFTYYSFHMALFTFISGYFFKDRNLKSFFKTKIKKLIIPYFSWNLIYGILVAVLRLLNIVKYGKSFSIYNLIVAPFVGSGNHFAFNVAAWFVISIFFIQLIYFVIYKIGKKLKIHVEIPLFILSIIIAFFELKYVVSGHNYGLYYLLTRLCFLFPFYCIGQIYKKYEDRIKINGIRTWVFFGIIIIIQTFLLEKFNIDYNLQKLTFKSNYIVYFIGSLNGIFFWLKVSKILSKYVEKNIIVNYIGNNTYSIMMHHVFSFFIMNIIILLINKITGLFQSFNFKEFQTHFFYFYNANPGLTLIYVLIGISLPLFGHFMYEKTKEKFIKKFSKVNSLLNNIVKNSNI